MNKKIKKFSLVNKLKFINNKKGIITHPVTLFIVGIVLGVVLMVLILKGIININLGLC